MCYVNQESIVRVRPFVGANPSYGCRSSGLCGVFLPQKVHFSLLNRGVFLRGLDSVIVFVSNQIKLLHVNSLSCQILAMVNSEQHSTRTYFLFQLQKDQIFCFCNSMKTLPLKVQWSWFLHVSFEVCKEPHYLMINTYDIIIICVSLTTHN